MSLEWQNQALVLKHHVEEIFRLCWLKNSFSDLGAQIYQKKFNIESLFNLRHEI